MVSKVIEKIAAHRLFSRGDTVIVAVSGGADSVALLDVLVCQQELQLSLVVAHLNHSLRGVESDRDEEFVRDLALSYGLPFEIRRVNVRQLSHARKMSLEEAGRGARYEYFRELAVRLGAGAIALGHHADDQAETVLMRLIRGAGVTGLAGMAPKTSDLLVRPLLGVTRRDIELYLAGRGLRYRSDSSNTDTTFLRNRIRHHLLPYLSTYNPSISDRLVVSAESLAADEAILQDVTRCAFERNGEVRDGAAILSVAGVRSEPLGIRLRLYRHAILLAMGSLARIAYRHLCNIDRLVLSEGPNRTLHLPQGGRVARSYASLAFQPAVQHVSATLPETIISGPGSHSLPGGRRLVVEKERFPDDFATIPASVAYFDASEAPFPWIVRGFLPGDRIVPLGMAGTRKVKDVFIDAKIPRQQRGTFPLIFSNDRLIWIGCLRVSAGARVTGRAGGVLRAEILDFPPCIDL